MFLEAAEAVLGDSDAALHYKEISAQVIQKALIQSHSDSDPRLDNLGWRRPASGTTSVHGHRTEEEENPSFGIAKEERSTEEGPRCQCSMTCVSDSAPSERPSRST